MIETETREKVWQQCSSFWRLYLNAENQYYVFNTIIELGVIFLVNSTQSFVLAILTQPIANLETFGDSILAREAQSELLFHGGVGSGKTCLLTKTAARSTNKNAFSKDEILSVQWKNVKFLSC